MPKHFSFLVLFLIAVLNWASAVTFYGTPTDYLGYVPQLQPGDTLQLEAGTYSGRLNLDDVVGEEGFPIVIMGPENSYDAVFLGNACCNTVSLERCAWLVIKNLTLDGQDIPYIDAVKAEGSNGNWTHHITIEHIRVINHGGASLTVGINTKCTSWDWIIRDNVFLSPGLGMYLGNSDGTGPFINGIIEYNLIVNPRRYGLQIKHQNEGLRTIPDMTLNGKTVIRYNVISKASGADPNTARPNLLVGNFPSSGDGSEDYYEIYGNFLWQNPAEGLFQGTGNIAFYNNVLVNHQPGGWGIFSFPHNGFNPRNLYYFNNTIICHNEGIDIDNPNPAFEQIVAGNAVFADEPLEIGNVVDDSNVTDTYNNAEQYLTNPFGSIPGISVTPLPFAQLVGTPLDTSVLAQFENFNLDFDGRTRGWHVRGAYIVPGGTYWNLALEIRPPVGGDPVDTNQEEITNTPVIYPNPVSQEIGIELNGLHNSPYTIQIWDTFGRKIFDKEYMASGINIDARDWSPGVYYLVVEVNGKPVGQKKLIKL